MGSKVRGRVSIAVTVRLVLSIPWILAGQGASTPTLAPLPSPPPVFYLDGVALSSTISEYLAKHRKPDQVSALTYNTQGGTLSIKTDSKGSIILVDAKAGPTEVRSVDVLGRLARFNDGGHMNNAPPDWVPYGGGDACSSSLKGSPCWGYQLPRDCELVMNFGADNGTADWNLTEVLLGSRAALISAGLVVSSSP